MEQKTFDGIIFADSLHECKALRRKERIIHVLCLQGSLSFTFQDTHYNVIAGDYVILPSGPPILELTSDNDFQGILMGLSDKFVASIAIRSDYGIIGHLSLLQNPVMKLSAHDFRLCRDALFYLQARMADTTHLFHEELLASLLTAHILDLYDIHARSRDHTQLSERSGILLRQFIELLHKGEFVRHRTLDFYASHLCITPQYLSEVCKKASGQPATYWIDYFTLREIMRLLRQKEYSLTEIAERLNFSSLSYFSRYVQKRIGMPPSDYKNSYALD